MLEIEVKAKVTELEALEKQIINRGWKFRKEVVEEDTYFNHPNRDFTVTDEALRLRKSGGKCYLTYKGPKVDGLTKTREEHNVEVGSAVDAQVILKNLGFKEVLPVRKTRRYYRLEEFDIMLDNVEGLGNYIEIEKRGEYKPQELLDLLEDLGIGESETRSYLELAIEKKRN